MSTEPGPATGTPVTQEDAPSASAQPNPTGIQLASTAGVQTDVVSQTQATQQETAVPSGTGLGVIPDINTSPAIFPTIDTSGTSTAISTAPASGSPSSVNGAANSIPTSSESKIHSTVAVAGGVIGSIVGLSMLAFFLWFWRRRLGRRRQSSLLTPLSTTHPGRGGLDPREEKGSTYEINRDSIGPTPRTERFTAALGYTMRQVSSRISQIVRRESSVNKNRGPSQFIASRNRADSSSSGVGYPTRRGDITALDRLKDWWFHLKSDIAFSRRLQTTKTPILSDPFASSRHMSERGAVKLPPPNSTTSMRGQPDFLTLLRLDDAETQRRQVSAKSGTSSLPNGHPGRPSLDLSNTNPFSDENSIAGERSGAKPAPLRINPFSDANAIVTSRNPSVYVASTRQSRTQSISAASPVPNTSRAPSTIYRDSATSVATFSTRQNKFRSDPFDLEPLRQQGGSLSSSTAGVSGSVESVDVVPNDVRRPTGAHVRAESLTSKYSSGVSRTSLRGWADPGPDVGPGAQQVGAVWEGKRVRGENQGSVGKAI